MNKCLRDSSDHQIWHTLAFQIRLWLNQDLLHQYVLLLVLCLPVLLFTEKTDIETQARTNHWRFELVLLLFRLALASSASVWMQMLFRQDRPCACLQDNQQFDFLGPFGMPSETLLVISVLSLHILHFINFPLGIVILILASYSEVVLGLGSCGQVLSAIAIGIALHIYTVVSPLILRLLDIFVNLVCGFCTIFILAKYDEDIDPDMDFTFTIRFFIGALWMVFSVILFVVYYEKRLLKKLSRVSTFSITYESFLLYTPIHDLSHGSDHFSPQRRFETFYVVLLVTVLFLGLWGLRVSAPYLNEYLQA